MSPKLLLPKFTQFIRERQYLHNVSPATVSWYTHAFHWMPRESPTEAELKAMVMCMREQGLKATGCNAAIRALNAYLKWSGSPHHIQQMKEPQLVLPVFTAGQVKLLVNWKPVGFYDCRLHVLVLLLLDCGLRISEALELSVRDVDLDNLLLTVNGKGGKQRIVPFSYELRKKLFIYMKDHLRPTDLILSHKDGRPLKRCVCLRQVKALCVRLGFTPPVRTLHAMRHTFGANYVRRGGSVFHLQKVLGHSSLEMSRRYANLNTTDIQEIHQKISLLTS